MIVVVGLFAIAGALFAVTRNPVALAVLLFVASALQRPLGAITGDDTALILDDAVLATVALYLLLHYARVAKSDRRAVVLIVVVLLSLGLAVVQATSLGVGLYQLRQIAVPLLLLLFGRTLTRDELFRIGPVIIALGIIASVYAVGERFGFYPIDPNDYGSINSTTGGATYGREFRGAFYYQLGGGASIVRSGSFLLNPPTFGIYAAAAAGWLWFTAERRASSATTIMSIILIVGTCLSLSRGGLLVLGLLAFQPLFVRRSGRLVFLILGTAAAVVGFDAVIDSGASSRHTDGLTFGIQYAATHPLGGGFGIVGNRLQELTGEAGEAGESLAGIFLTGCGWIAILAIGFLIHRALFTKGSTLPGAALAGATFASLLAESAGGLDGTGSLWLLAGVALAGGAASRSGSLAIANAVDTGTRRRHVGARRPT